MLTNRDLPNITLEYSNKERFYLALPATKPISFERRFYATVILHWIYHETPDFFSYLQKMNVFLPLNEHFARTFFIYMPCSGRFASVLKLRVSIGLSLQGKTTTKK